MIHNFSVWLQPVLIQRIFIGFEAILETFFRLAGPVILVEISYLGGQAGRDGVHQILQYIKNKHAALKKN